MYYIIYLSSATTLLNETALAGILQQSRKNNEKQGITGMLIYNDGNIIQLLEGERASVMNTYRRIEVDYRHRGVIKLIDGEAEQRLFPDWTMGYRAVSATELAGLTGFVNLRDKKFLATGVAEQQDVIFTLLQTFVKNNV